MALKIRTLCIFIAVALAIFEIVPRLVGFSFADEKQPSTAESIRHDVEREAMENAMNAFNTGDYKRAKIGFEVLSETSQNPEIRSQALFSLASVKFALADTSSEYEDALLTWKKWSGQAASREGCEDPKMLTPFLSRLQPSVKCDHGSRSCTKIHKTAKEIDSKVILLQTKEKEMQTLRSKLDLREREIRRLRHQLESLEEIHREYQEKKQEANP